jgi:leader peptidase (prepilin peptidase)/N-methyltransferase
MTLETLGYWAFGLLGAAIGSFLNVCVSRWPNDESVVSPRSRCPRCSRPITWYENIPVLSWIVLRAKCAGCGLPISVQYPAVELGVALLWVASCWLFGPTIMALRLAVFATLLLGVLLTDFQAYVIPDGFTITGLVVALAGAVYGTMHYANGPFATFPEAIVGACAGAGVVAIAGWLGEAMLKREAMGFGDVTLMAMVGAHVGAPRALLTVVAGAVVGLVVTLVFLLPLVLIRRARGGAPEPATVTEGSTGDGATDDGVPPPGWLGLPAIPFGVFLAPAALIVLLWGDAFIEWYLAHPLLA